MTTPVRPSEPSQGAAAFPWVQIAALVLGFLLLMFGLAGFWPTSFESLGPGDSPARLLGIEVSPLHNTLHIALGLVGMISATRLSAARKWGWLLVAAGVVFVVMGVVGVVSPDLDVLGMNIAAIVVEALIALAGLVLAVGPVHRPFPFTGPRQQDLPGVR